MTTTSATSNRKQLVLLGMGRTHVQILKSLVRRNMGGVDVTLVTLSPKYIESRMLAGYMAGQYAPDDLCRPLDELVEMSRVNFVPVQVIALDPATRQIQLVNGDVLPYDVLSIDGDPAADREVFDLDIPGTRQHALFVHPRMIFVQLWPRLCDLAMERALHIAVIGDDLAAAELAMTAAPVLAAPHGSRVTWIAGNAQNQPPLASEPPKLARRVLARLKRLHVTVLQDHCVGLDGQSAQLASGASLQCDAPIITGSTGYPAWLRQSGLQLTGEGMPMVNEWLQSDSHHQIFITPLDASAEYGPVLDGNLRAALGDGMFGSMPKVARSHVVGGGKGQAIAVWGPFVLEGRLAWRWLDRRNRERLASLLTI